jgi:SEC-C motif domain protein
LMRSRYTAFALANMEYLKKTLAAESHKDFDIEENRRWAKESKWKGLQILKTEKGGPDDVTGVVEFVATYVQNGKAVDHHEVYS